MNSQLREQERISSLIDNEADDCIKGYLQNDVISTKVAASAYGGAGLMIGQPISTTISNSIDSPINKVTTVEVLPRNYIMQLDSIQESIQELYDNLSVHDIHHRLHEIESMIDKLRNTDFKLDQSESIHVNTPVYAPTPNDLVINKELCFGGTKSQGTLTFKNAEVMSIHVDNTDQIFHQMSVDPLIVERVPSQEVHIELRCSNIEETSN